MRRLALLMTLCACGGSSDDPAPDAAPRPDAAAATCPAAADAFDWPLPVGTGDSVISGRIDLPEVSSGRIASLGVWVVGDQILRISDQPTNTTCVRYRLSGLGAGTYYVDLLVDADGDLQEGPGDWGGFYAGTTAAPALHDGFVAITVDGTATETVADFGVGPYACLGGYGDDCTTDADCRGTETACDDGTFVRSDVGACQGVCTALPAASCGGATASSTREVPCYGPSI
ncbi:MAG: hypothetical protein KC464_15010 [Myxococcales bacterium]|nr:hypothetical protein [Myxococcales bacterium]